MSFTAFPFRMGAGFAGTVNRLHPATIEPALNDPDAPVLGYGLAVMVDGTNNSVRQMAPGDDGATAVYGISCRPYPFQQSTGGAAAAFGAATPPEDQPVDVLRAGYILMPTVGAPVKGGQVYIWVAADSGDHVQGGAEVADDGANTIALTGAGSVAKFNGPADANGVAEVMFNI
jgi:hypothetical protein